MTAIALPEIDRSTVDDLRKRMPSLSELELPALPTRQQVGKTADQTIDRLLGRSRPSVWPWVAGVGLAAVIAAIAAYFLWFRRPTGAPMQSSWSSELDALETAAPGQTAADGADVPSATAGLTAAETSLTSHPYPTEES